MSAPLPSLPLIRSAPHVSSCEMRAACCGEPHEGDALPSFHAYVCAAFLHGFRSSLIGLDFQELLLLLQANRCMAAHAAAPTRCHAALVWDGGQSPVPRLRSWDTRTHADARIRTHMPTHVARATAHASCAPARTQDTRALMHMRTRLTQRAGVEPQRLPTEHWGEREIAMMLSQAFIWCAQYESVASHRGTHEIDHAVRDARFDLVGAQLATILPCRCTFVPTF
jgi:hypothetical protein